MVCFLPFCVTLAKPRETVQPARRIDRSDGSVSRTDTAGLAVLQAAQARRKLAVGSANKGFSDPDTLLTSTAKRVDAVVFQAFGSMAQERWRSGEFTVGLAEGALDWTPENYDKELITKCMWDCIDAARAAIVSGRIRVHDFAATNSCPR